MAVIDDAEDEAWDGIVKERVAEAVAAESAGGSIHTSEAQPATQQRGLFLRESNARIGGDYLHRWWLIPRNRFFNVYLHKFMCSDDDRALHCHPWYSASLLLKGEMIEHSFKGIRHIPRILPIFRTAKFAHRLELVKGPVWTIFITGPRIREWGFYRPSGWKHWRTLFNADGSRSDGSCE